MVRWERIKIGPAYLQTIIIGTLCGMDGTCYATVTRCIRTIACENKHHETTAELRAVVAYTELEGVQSRMDGEEEGYPPFFLRQESHALGRFCTIDMAVAIKGLLWAADASTHQVHTLDLLISHSRYMILPTCHLIFRCL